MQVDVEPVRIVLFFLAVMVFSYVAVKVEYARRR